MIRKPCTGFRILFNPYGQSTDSPDSSQNSIKWTEALKAGKKSPDGVSVSQGSV